MTVQNRRLSVWHTGARSRLICTGWTAVTEAAVVMLTVVCLGPGAYQRVDCWTRSADRSWAIRQGVPFGALVTGSPNLGKSGGNPSDVSWRGSGHDAHCSHLGLGPTPTD